MNKQAHQGPRSRTPHNKQSGLFITFEGVEGSGKSTQCRILAEHLERLGFLVTETREPGGTPTAESIRDLFLQITSNSSDSITPETESALVFAARSQHIVSLLLPALRNRAIVLCDRFSDSTLAYQGYGRGIDIQDLKRFDRFVSRGLKPDMTFLFDLPVQQGLARRQGAPNQNRMDRESLAFHTRVRKGFLELARQHPNRITVINARRPEEAISKQIRILVEPTIKKRFRSHQISLI